MTPSVQTSSILIVTVTKVETQAVHRAFVGETSAAWERKIVGDKIYYPLGIHGDVPVVLVQSEMGTATPGGAILTVRQAIQDIRPQAVIMCGIAFGLWQGWQKIGDILVSQRLHSYEPAKIDLHRGEIPRGDSVTCSERLLARFRSGDNEWAGASTHFGLILSGEKLINDATFRDQLVKQEKEAIGGEMEGAGLYTAARDGKVDWILVKAICDWADGNKTYDSQPLAAKNAAEFVLFVIDRGGWDDSSQPEPRNDRWDSDPPPPQIRPTAPNAIQLNLQNLSVLNKPIPLIGRDSMIKNIQKALDDGTPVLLQGFSGAGKTSIAAEFASHYVHSGLTPVIWWRIEDADEATMFQGLARIFGRHHAEAIDDLPPLNRKTYLQGLLNGCIDDPANCQEAREGNVKLLILDNAENGSALSALLPLIPRQTALLVTSTHRFSYDRLWRFEVKALSETAALALLRRYELNLQEEAAVELLREYEQHLPDDPDAKELCRILDYLPFALRIAGKTLHDDNQTARELLERIENDAHEIKLRYGEEPGRESIAALIAAKLSKFDDEGTCDVFYAFGSFFDHSATPELMRLYQQHDKKIVNEQLDKLWDAGLIDLVPEQRGVKDRYYKVHNLAYSYARAIRQPNWQTVIDACRKYVEANLKNFAALDTEINNILMAADKAAVLDPKSLIQITRLLAIDGPYYEARGYNAYIIKLLETAAEIARRQNDFAVLGEFMDRIAYNYANALGKPELAESEYQKVLELADEHDDLHLKAMTLARLGTLLMRRDQAKALSLYDEAEALATSHYDNHALSLIYQHRSFYFTIRGNNKKAEGKPKEEYEQDYGQGRDFATKAVEIAASLKFQRIHVLALLNLGGCEKELGDLKQALKHHQAGYGIAKQENNYVLQARILESIGEDYDANGQVSEAEAAFNEALRLWRWCDSKARSDDLIDFITSLGQDKYHIKAEYRFP